MNSRTRRARILGYTRQRYRAFLVSNEKTWKFFKRQHDCSKSKHLFGIVKGHPSWSINFHFIVVSSKRKRTHAERHAIAREMREASK